MEKVLNWLNKIGHSIGWHGNGNIDVYSEFHDYYHNRFTYICRVCKKIVHQEIKYGDWG